MQEILLQPNVHYVSSDNNMTAPITSEVPHECVGLVREEMNTFPNIVTEAINNADSLFTDGHSNAEPGGGIIASYAVVSRQASPIREHLWETLESDIIPPPVSAQLAVIIAITRACELSEGRLTSILTLLML